MHAMAAGAFDTPELALDDDEAKQIANATAEVAKHYSVNIDPKTLAWMNFGWAVSCVYGSRVVAITMRRRNEKEAAKKAKQNFASPTADEETPAPVHSTGFPPADAL
jgi:hypothetical protein